MPRALAYKAGVRVRRRTQALDHIENCALEVQAELGYPKVLVVTSANDSGHSKIPLSRHYTDEALDFRTKTNPPGGMGDMGSMARKVAFRKRLQAKLGTWFLAQIHSAGTPNEHCHCQTLKGKTYP